MDCLEPLSNPSSASACSSHLASCRWHLSPPYTVASATCRSPSTGDLGTCTARAEVNLIDRHSGRVLLADRRTARALDLAELTAGKTALQIAGRQLGVAVCRALVDYRAPAGAGSKPPPAKAGSEAAIRAICGNAARTDLRQGARKARLFRDRIVGGLLAGIFAC